MKVVLIVTLIILIASAASYIILFDIKLYIIKILLIAIIIAGCLYLGENKKQLDKKEQPKYKQEIVYSLKDGKYLPTDTLYIEIK